MQAATTYFVGCYEWIVRKMVWKRLTCHGVYPVHQLGKMAKKKKKKWTRKSRGKKIKKVWRCHERGEKTKGGEWGFQRGKRSRGAQPILYKCPTVIIILARKGMESVPREALQNTSKHAASRVVETRTRTRRRPALQQPHVSLSFRNVARGVIFHLCSSGGVRGVERKRKKPRGF